MICDGVTKPNNKEYCQNLKELRENDGIIYGVL